jgi:hypothetical protein
LMSMRHARAEKPANAERAAHAGLRGRSLLLHPSTRTRSSWRGAPRAAPAAAANQPASAERAGYAMARGGRNEGGASADALLHCRWEDYARGDQSQI